MICPACGKETPSTSNYCIHCGILVETDTAPTQLLTPEMEQMMFGDKKSGISDELKKSTSGDKGYNFVSDARINGSENEYGRTEWNSGPDSRAAGNAMGQNYQMSSIAGSGNAYADVRAGSSAGYTGTGSGYANGQTVSGAGYTGTSTGYSNDHTIAGAGYAGSGAGSSNNFGNTGSGYSDSYAGAGSGYSDSYAGAGSGYSDSYAGTGSGYSDTKIFIANESNYAGMDLTPISVLGYIGYSFLFAIPVVGLIFMIIYSLGSNRKVNLKNYARSYLVLYIIGFIFSLVIYLLFATFYR